MRLKKNLISIKKTIRKFQMKNQFAISKIKKLLSINFEYVSTNKKKRIRNLCEKQKDKTSKSY